MTYRIISRGGPNFFFFVLQKRRGIWPFCWWSDIIGTFRREQCEEYAETMGYKL